MKSFIRICILLVGLCDAIPKEDLFPYGVQDDRLSSGTDDVSSPEVQLSVPIVFFETIYKSIFVSHQTFTEKYLIAFV